MTRLIQIAREKRVSAYVGDGANRWATAPLKDVAHLYRLAVEKTSPGITTYHAVQKEGLSLQNIAETIGKGLKVPVVSISAEQAGEHFGMFFGHAATLNMPASSEWTRKTLRWEPNRPGLIEDLTLMKYCSGGANAFKLWRYVLGETTPANVQFAAEGVGITVEPAPV